MASVDEHRNRLQQLMSKRVKAQKENHHEVVEEDRRSKLPSNWEARKARLEYEEEEDQFKQKCKEDNEDYDRCKNLETSSCLIDRLELRKQRKRNIAQMSESFSTYEAASYRKYLKQVKNLKVDLKSYQQQKDKLGELAYPTANTLGLIGQHKDKPEAIERLANTIKDEGQRKAAYSRRRAFDVEADIDYINERNKRYNELLDRHYGKYTAEIKQNLERGTAL